MLRNFTRHPISPNLIGKNVEIVRPDVMTGVRTPVSPLYVCEFTMVLSSCLSIKKSVYRLVMLNTSSDHYYKLVLTCAPVMTRDWVVTMLLSEPNFDLVCNRMETHLTEL